jgi:diguanylate cyclase (GGDEF)-like protein
MSSGPSATTHRSIPRLLAGYGLVTLVPVIALGIGLALAIRSSATHRGLSQGRLEGTLIAQTAVEPNFGARPLSQGLSRQERSTMDRLVHRAVAGHHVLRMRLRDLAGNVVFSDDPSERADADDNEEALTAAHGTTVVHLTHLNSDDDDDDSGSVGPASIEVYLPLMAGQPARRIGVLELYLPYAPIAAEVQTELHVLYLALALGLAALYVALFVITLSVTRRLRQQVASNAFLAQHDALTQLPNRAMFLERAHRAVEAARRLQRASTIAIIDLDRFKEINDTLGHATGDELLTKVAKRLAAQMRPGDSIARLGGDEFGLILTDAPDPAHALERLRVLIHSEVEVRGLSLSVEPSIGYVVARDGTYSVETLIQQADVAMYEAKAQHSGPVEYRAELDRYDAADIALMSQLRAAIPAGQLVLHYQPQIDTTTGAVRTVEALVRWQHPEHGLLAPGRFLPMAEHTDLIDQITDWVLETALEDVAAFADRGTPLAVAVNASARSIVRTEFATKVLASLERYGVSPERLIVEVTETALLTDPQRAAEVLSLLAAAGVRLSIDDFGAGHTSLGYLSALPVNELKIDRSFVTDLDESSAHAAIVRSVIELGHNLSMRVVAEGIETADVLARLAELSCDLAQGYLIARPMPVEALSDFVDRQASHVPTLDEQR